MADKNEKVQKPNALQKWWRETIGELHKVVWPSRKEALRLTWIVIAVIVHDLQHRVVLRVRYELAGK